MSRQYTCSPEVNTRQSWSTSCSGLQDKKLRFKSSFGNDSPTSMQDTWLAGSTSSSHGYSPEINRSTTIRYCNLLPRNYEERVDKCLAPGGGLTGHGSNPPGCSPRPSPPNLRDLMSAHGVSWLRVPSSPNKSLKGALAPTGRGIGSRPSPNS
ncbi:hypothetical protein PGTUg99_021023 [Puccinia graminis f. sp. tritici]|uniref:Uncharacterized protein n=1 Tax=Puccinia graminis f. sp. tritici TaxID=56615 RepID=A0A5B0SHZ0_PUCGR|nr:hypothetical protein PGTUg99_021023 [Puccinia graminis f. sp. tritici]